MADKGGTALSPPYVQAAQQPTGDGAGMRRGRAGGPAAVVLVLAASVMGCAEDNSPPLVTRGKPSAKPYSGPLRVPYKKTPHDTPQAMKISSGAAGQALECAGRISSGGFSGPWSKGDGGATPEEGLRAYFDIEQPELPEYGYRVEREEAGRVLYSFDVDGKTKIAVVVAKDQPRRPGWGPETSASCDPAELPPSFTDNEPYEIWTDQDGDRVPVSKVSSSAGSAHCDWQKAHILELDSDTDRRLYARDPSGVLPPEMLTSHYDGDVTLPGSARATGYRLDDWELWLAADASKAYVRTPEGVEAWPAVKKGMACQ